MTKNKADIKQLEFYFRGQSVITLSDLRRFYQQKQPGIPDNTVNWRVFQLVNASVLRRVGRGIFEFGANKVYQPNLPSRAIKVNKFIHKNFPLISFCTWSSGLLNEFAQHISGYPFILADIEREAAESVYFQLKDEFNGVFFQPSQQLINDLLPDFHLPIVVRFLTSESPLKHEKGMYWVTLEKMLVDVFCDSEFSYLQGSEQRSIFENAFDKYTIKQDMLLRYAARKGKRTELSQYLSECDLKIRVND